MEIRILFKTRLLNARLRGPLQKKLYNGFMKRIVVRSSLPLRNSCSVLFLALKKQKQSINLTTLPYDVSLSHYIYSNEINSKGIYMREFINKLSQVQSENIH